MNAENPSVSKFQVVTETVQPHRCLACWRYSDGKLQFLDFGLSLDTEDPLFVGVPDSALGVVYICEDCLKEGAALFGLVPPSVAEDFAAKMEDILERTNRLETENDGLHRTLDYYRAVLRDLGVSSDTVSAGEEQGDSVSTEAESGLVESSSE